MKSVGVPEAPEQPKISNLNESPYKKGYNSDGDLGPIFNAVEDALDEELMAIRQDESFPISIGGN